MIGYIQFPDLLILAILYHRKNNYSSIKQILINKLVLWFNFDVYKLLLFREVKII